jgi:hypothetical protein
MLHNHSVDERPGPLACHWLAIGSHPRFRRRIIAASQHYDFATFAAVRNFPDGRRSADTIPPQFRPQLT